MNYATLKTALVAWVKALLGSPTGLVVVWKNQTRPQHNGTLVVLSWVSSGRVGRDEIRYEIDDDIAPPLDNAVPVQVGNRRMTLQVMIDTLNTDPASLNAEVLTERLRARIMLPSSVAALDAAKLALHTIGDPITLQGVIVDQHEISRSVIEVRFNASTFERGTTEDDTSTIEAADLTSEFLNGPDGTPLPDPLQVTNKVIP